MRTCGPRDSQISALGVYGVIRHQLLRENNAARPREGACTSSIPMQFHTAGTVFPWPTSTSICQSLAKDLLRRERLLGIFRSFSVLTSIFQTGSEIRGDDRRGH
jgi:hypothetical protein